MTEHVLISAEDAEEYTQSLGQIGGGLWRQILWAHKQGIPEALGLTLREWVDGRLGGYVRMAATERKEIHKQLTTPADEGGEGLTQREAADVTGTSAMTVNRDLADDPVSDVTNDPSEVLVEASLDDEPVSDVTDLVPDSDELPDPDRDRTEEIQELARQRQPEPVADPPPLPQERFACIVIDPPWPMPKIERKERAWQGTALDYPVMTLDEVAALPVSDLADDDCHLYLWVTHKFLPAGLDLLSKWGFRYQCVMTWNKNVGITPYSWMYDTEHVLFASRGKLKLLKRGQRLSFEEPVNGHSVKPEVFYDRVRAASPGPRLEMFARSERSGFTPWGNEISAHA